MPQSRAWENPGRETDSSYWTRVERFWTFQLNPHLPLKTGEQPKPGAAHHLGPCHLISSIRLYPCFPLDTRYCVASSAFHSVKGSFIPAPPASGMLNRKRRGVSGILWTQFCPMLPRFSPLSSLLCFLGGPWLKHSKTFQFHPCSPRYESHNFVSRSFTIPFAMCFFFVVVVF